MKLNIRAFALACGLIWGVGLFALTWWVIAFEGTTDETGLLGHVYRGYSVSPLGSLIGMLWGFADGFVGGALFAWLYNRMTPCKPNPEKEFEDVFQPDALK
jgi:hypothetical protein